VLDAKVEGAMAGEGFFDGRRFDPDDLERYIAASGITLL
jgi:hypothetical protein